MSIKVEIYQTSTIKTDITNMVKGIDWSGDINTLPRSVNISFQNTAVMGTSQLVRPAVGNLVMVYSDGTEIFRGFIFKTNINQNGEASFTAYDMLIYATKNATTILVKGKNAGHVIREQFQAFGIPVGSIPDTHHTISKKLFENKDLAGIAEECLEEEKLNSGWQYVIWSEKGKVYMAPRHQVAKTTF